MPSAGRLNRLIVTGAGGFKGWPLCRRARSTRTAYGLWRHHPFGKTILDAIQTNATIRLFADEFRTPVDGESAADGIPMALSRTTGILHPGGRTRISRLETGCRLASIMGSEDAMTRALRADTVATDARRPPDVSLDSRRADSPGHAPERLDRAPAHMVRDYRECRS
jgi:dTDP-4-dehydrorhamnose reductase